jgi:hypothetical protein
LHKLLAIALLAVFGLPFVSPLFAITSMSGTNLPACCRRDGKHHCVMTKTERSEQENDKPVFTAPIEKCPYSPPAILGTHHPMTFALPSRQLVYAESVTHPVGTAQTESKLRISRDRARGKRGPPAFSIL